MRTTRSIQIAVLVGLLALAVVGVVLIGNHTATAQGPGGAPPWSPEAPFPNVERRAGSAPEAPEDVTAATNYQHISGSVFVPLYDTAHAVYAGSGCMYLTGTSLFLNSPVILPYQSTITQMRLYYKDTNVGTNGTLWLAQYDDGLGYTYLITLTTTGNGGWGTATQNVNAPLDTINYSYTVLWSSGGVADSTLQLCGYRVAYTAPGLFGAALPYLAK